MGYSARQDAFKTLERFERNTKGNEGSNVYIGKNGVKYFYEIDREKENEEGSIEGDVHSFNDGMKRGTFKIAGNGAVVRFPQTESKMFL